MPDGSLEDVKREVIRGRRVEADAWRTLGLDPNEDLSSLPPGPVIVPFGFFKTRHGALAARGEPFGVWLAPDDDPEDLASRISRLAPPPALVAVHFPKWGDGRGYSLGALLRGRFGWRGELRAFGEIGRDHLFYLARCGFDAFALAPHRDAHAALAGLADFSLAYQGAVEDPQPLFRKRASLPAGGAR